MPRTDMLQASEIDATLERLVHHTLEVMCFAEAERLPRPSPLDCPIETHIDFSGSHAGHLQLEIESAAARSLAAAFLGLELSHPSLASETGDATAELARVLCGRLVTSLDPATPFEMMPANDGSSKSAETIRQTFRVPSGTLCITLQIS